MLLDSLDQIRNGLSPTGCWRKAMPLWDDFPLKMQQKKSTIPHCA